MFHQKQGCFRGCSGELETGPTGAAESKHFDQHQTGQRRTARKQKAAQWRPPLTQIPHTIATSPSRYIAAINASPNSEHFTSVAPGISRAKS
jgi:hypothetical protein